MESALPPVHRLAGAFGRHRQEEGLPVREHRHSLLHHSHRALAVDREAAEPSHQGPQGAAKELHLGDEAHIEAQRKDQCDPDEEIPVRRMRRRGNARLAQVGKPGADPPAQRAQHGPAERGAERAAATGNPGARLGDFHREKHGGGEPGAIV